MSRKRAKKEPEQAVKLRRAKGDRDGGEGGPGSSIYSMQTEYGVYQVNQYFLFQELHKVLLDSQGDPLKMLLERIAEVGRQVFRFQRAAVSLLNQEEALFFRRVKIGYGISQAKNTGNGTVPQEVIDRLFGNRYRVRMVYSKGEPRSDADYFDDTKPERRRWDRRPSGEWEHGDVVLVCLKGEKGETVGFIRFDTPEDGQVGSRDLFKNLELFGQWTSFAIAQHTQISAMKKHAQRLKQLLVSSNIFKLDFNLHDLLTEIVWGIKHSSEFNLVGVGLIDKKTSNLEMQAVACDDKIIKNRLLELQFPKKALHKVFRDEYKWSERSKSYLILKPERVFRSFKQVYYGSALSEEKREGKWPNWGLLIVPIRDRASKIIGLLIADDPADSQLPGEEDIQVLDTMSNQFGIAIENRILYRDMRRRTGKLDRIKIEEEPDYQEEPTRYIAARMSKRLSRKP
jgi:hypothetical protein